MQNEHGHRLKLIVFSLCLLLAFAPTSRAEQPPAHPAPHHHHGHGHHVVDPAGLMGAHVMAKGEAMVTLRYATMRMQGLQNGTQDIGTEAVFDQGFMVSPTSMDTEMTMLSGMMGVTNDTTVMAMVPYVVKSMDHLTASGATFTTRAEGLGDAKISAVHRLQAWTEGTHELLILGRLSLPTGATDKRDRTPASPDAKLPYPMQLGTGTVDPTLGLTYRVSKEAWSYGGQALVTARLGRNDQGYRRGDELTANLWTSYTIPESPWTLSARLLGHLREDIEGQDDELTPMMVPTADADLRSVDRLELFAGLRYDFGSGLYGNTLMFEAGLPLYEDLDGPQLETDLRAIAAWQVHF